MGQHQLTVRTHPTLLLLTFCVLLSACRPNAVPASSPPAPSIAAPAGFVNKVWRVTASSSVSPGTLYVFLSEGTLIVTSPDSRPSIGTWKFEDDALTMVEESIPYKVEILALGGNEFRIRSHNPGTPVEITLALAQ